MCLLSSQCSSRYFVATTMKCGKQLFFVLCKCLIWGPRQAPNLPQVCPVLLMFTHHSLGHLETHTRFPLPLGILSLPNNAPLATRNSQGKGTYLEKASQINKDQTQVLQVSDVYTGDKEAKNQHHPRCDSCQEGVRAAGTLPQKFLKLWQLSEVYG